jgi:hypothetical protein
MTNTKTLLTLSLTLSKSTKGTHVLANDEAGLSIYVPKLYFMQSGCKPEGKFQITITEVK